MKALSCCLTQKFPCLLNYAQKYEDTKLNVNSLKPDQDRQLSQFLCDKEKMYKAGFVFNRGADGEYDVKFNKTAIFNALMEAEKDTSEPTGQYDGPAYFIYGSISPFGVGKEEDHIKKFFPNAELIPVEGAAHDVHLGFPEKFLELVLQRLRK